MAEAGGGRSGSGPARPPEWWRGRGGGEVPGGTGRSRGKRRLPRGAGSRREETSPGQRARQDPGRPGRACGTKTRRESQGRRCSRLPRGESALPCLASQIALVSCQRRPPGATSSKCPPIPWVTEAFATEPGSRPRPAAGPAWDSLLAINGQRPLV